MDSRDRRFTHARGRAAATAAALTLLLLVTAAPASATTLPAGFTESVAAAGSGFSAPVAVAFAPDGRMFVAEKAGRVQVVPAGSTTPRVLLDIRNKVNSRSDRGMLGIATDKDFATNGWLYLLYVKELQPLTPDSESPMVSVLTRVTVNPDNTLQNPTSPETTILGKADTAPCPTPDNTVDCIPADYKMHVIGTVKSDPVDGTLWVGTGDAHAHAVDANSYRPLDENTYAGKILHIDRQGRGLPNHPFCPSDTNLDHVCTKIYAKGFRNPFRFTLREGKGPVVGDVGAGDREELDLIKPGKSYGWPCYEAEIRTPLYANTARCGQEYAKEGTSAAHEPPNWSYARGDGSTILAGPVYSGSAYPADFRGDIFVGDYVQGWVKRLEVDDQDRITAVHDFATDWPTGVDLQEMPGTGEVAYVDIGWEDMVPAAIRRWSYSGGNGVPVPVAAAMPTSGDAPLTVQFTGHDSSDPDGDELTYDWDFGDGTPHSSSADPVHVYQSPGSYTARLTVDDGTGRNPSDTVTIQVGGNDRPTASIAAPADESLYDGGQTIQLQGSGSDPEDGTLAGSSLRWHVLLHHGSHLHEVTEFTGASGSFQAYSDHDADSFYEIRLTATDSGGMTDTRVIEVRPRTSQLTLASSPPGAPIGYGGAAPQPAPYTKTAAVGYRATVSAAPSFVKDGISYSFSGWSDGGAQQHEIDVPASNSTLTATYEPVDDVETLTFTPDADTYVDSASPTSSFGTSSRLQVDRVPTKQAFLRFPVMGIGGREVVGVRLRMHQRDSSRTGGRVYRLGTNSWSESMTYNTRPAISGTPAATFGAVSAGNWYEVALGAGFVSGDGAVSIAMDSASSDGAKWSSRHGTNPPRLLVDVKVAPGTVLDGLSQVAAAGVGSYDPTFYAANHRMALSAGGRLLAVHGRAGQGVQLAWRDPGGGWRNVTRGAVTDGLLLGGTGTGDWPASIAVARDSGGAEHAWVVWSHRSSSGLRAVQMRRLSQLDSPDGPSVGPVVTVDAPARGAYKADIGFERTSSGAMRGALLWSRRTGDTTYELVTAWFTNLATDTPAISGQTVLLSSSSSRRVGTLVPAPGGIRAVVRGSSSSLRVYSHAESSPLGTWTAGVRGAALASSASPAAVALDSGETLATAEKDTSAGVILVQRFAASGASVTTDLELTGYAHPALATDGARAWLVMIRKSDGFVVSRTYTPGSGWSSSDRVEVGAEGGGGYSWPNVVRGVDGRLRLLVRGPSGGSGRYAVLAYQREVDAPRVAAADETAPLLSSSELGSTALRAGAGVTTLRFVLSEPALVTVRVERSVRAHCARRGGGRARRKGRAKRRGRPRARRCREWRKLSGSVRRRGKHGRNALRLSARAGGRALPPGAYRLVIAARDTSGNRAAPTRLAFRVLPRR